MEEIELILLFTTCVIQIFVHQVCINSLFDAIRLVESYKLYHTNCLPLIKKINDLWRNNEDIR